MPSRCASAVISSLSIPMSGRSTGIVDDVVDRREVLERLRRDLADDFPGHQRLRAVLARDLLGDPHHQPAVDDDPQRRRHAQRDLLLDLAERHQEQPRMELEPGEQPRELARLLLRRARQDRVAVEVHEQDPAAAPHQPPRGDRRVDAAGEQARDAAADAHRQAAGPAFLAEVVERLVGQRFDVDRELGVVEIDRPALAPP